MSAGKESVIIMSDIPEDSVVRKGFFFTRIDGGISAAFPLDLPGNAGQTYYADEAAKILSKLGFQPVGPAIVRQYTTGKMAQLDWPVNQNESFDLMLKNASIKLYTSLNAALAVRERRIYGGIEL
jgi:hypothetical protein